VCDSKAFVSVRVESLVYTVGVIGPSHFAGAVGMRSRASGRRLSDNDIRCSASDRRWFPAAAIRKYTGNSLTNVCAHPVEPSEITRAAVSWLKKAKN